MGQQERGKGTVLGAAKCHQMRPPSHRMAPLCGLGNAGQVHAQSLTAGMEPDRSFRSMRLLALGREQGELMMQ